MLVQQSLSPETIEISETAAAGGEVISLLAGRLARRLNIDARTIERAVLDRERTRTTAFANGAAIPHCRLPGLSRFGIAVMILRQPVRWDNDGHAVDTVMMITGPSESVSDHLRILANGSQLLDSPQLRGKLKRSPDTRSAYELICAAEEQIERRRTQEGMLREIRKDGAANEADPLAEVAARFDW